MSPKSLLHRLTNRLAKSVSTCLARRHTRRSTDGGGRRLAQALSTGAALLAAGALSLAGAGLTPLPVFASPADPARSSSLTLAAQDDQTHTDTNGNSGGSSGQNDPSDRSSSSVPGGTDEQNGPSGQTNQTGPSSSDSGTSPSPDANGTDGTPESAISGSSTTQHGRRQRRRSTSGMSALNSQASRRQTKDLRNTTGLSLSLRSSRAVVTQDSGWTATLTIINRTDQPLEKGRVEALFSTTSLTTAAGLQSWEDGALRSTPNLLASADVRPLAKGSSATVTLTAPASDAIFSYMRSWGVKPVLLRYVSRTEKSDSAPSKTVGARLHTVFSRTRGGLQGEQTPPLTITPVLPVSATKAGWTTTASSVSNLLRDPKSSDDLLTQSAASLRNVDAAEKLLASQPSLQGVVDPLLLRSLSLGTTGTASSPSARTTALSLLQHASALMQPARLDLSARSKVSDTAWSKAGLLDQDWSAATAASLSQDALQEASVGRDTGKSPSTQTAPSSPSSSKPSSKPTVAWENGGSWTTDSLAAAARNGYRTVIAESARAVAPDGTIQSGRLDVPTSSGTVSVLVPQETLTSLARGTATSAEALAEKTDAGRLARLIAQSAVYQMQLPYKSRTLLLALDQTVHASRDAHLLSTLKSCDWLSLGTLADFQKLPADESAAARFTLGSRTGLSTEAVTDALLPLTSTTNAIARIQRSVLRSDGKTAANTAQDENPQPLARQNAKSTAEDTVSQAQWIAKLRHAHRLLALGGLSATARQIEKGTNGCLNADETLGSKLLNAVTVNPPSHVNLFSQTARAPVTVTNHLPYPVRVTLSARTTTAAMSVTGGGAIDVSALSESQTAFTVHVIGTLQSDATIRVLDRSGKTLGHPVTMSVYSQLTLNDMSGNVFVLLAVLLGALGFYRQFHKKKDPDQ